MLLDLGGSRERVEERQGERDPLGDPLRIELVVRGRQLGVLVGEDEREIGLELAALGH
jgi:hypothetical protein